MYKTSKNYQATAALATSPLDQVALLFDLAAKHVRKAKEAIQKQDYEARFFETTKAANIIHGLAGIINNENEQTKVLIGHMSEFFEKISYAIYEVNLKNEPALCDSLERALRDMADTWRDKSKGNAAPEAENKKGNVVC